MTQSLLLTNDDGYNAPGLTALWRGLEPEFDTLVVAPSRQRSWIGKAITNPEPLTIEEKTIEGKRLYIVNEGTPADCTNLGLFHLAERKPDFVISGINPGANFTNSLALASGTVGGALEAALNGVLGIAVSLDLDAKTEKRLRDESFTARETLFEPAAHAVREFLRMWHARQPDPRIRLVNLVVPQYFSMPVQFVECTPLPYEYGSVFERRGDKFYNRGRGFIETAAEIVPASDVWTVQQGEIAYTCYTGNLERVIAGA